MTIGIVMKGPDAGRAMFASLQTVEKVGRGAIGGFVCFVAVDNAGKIHTHTTQRGGTRTLFTCGEVTGIDPPNVIASAPLVALISSGPDRPEPLSQFLTVRPGIGLVTGHRIPNTRDLKTGRPLNVRILDDMEAGLSVDEACTGAVDDNPNADAGFVVMDWNGRVHVANTSFVRQRPDVGSAVVERSGVTLGVLHNSIYPVNIIAPLVTEVAFDTLFPQDKVDARVKISSDCRYIGGTADRAFMNEQCEVVVIERVGELDFAGPAVPFGTPILRHQEIKGRCIDSPFVVVKGGEIESRMTMDHGTIGIRLSL